MANPLSRWHHEHVRFGQVLDLLDEQLAAFRAGREPNYELMHDIVYCLENFAHRFHHRHEDVAFERLAEHEPALRMVTNRLLQEHRVIAWAGHELLERLAAVTEDVIVARTSVEAAASTYLVYYRHHLATEESDILPRAARCFTAEDWQAVAAAVQRSGEPPHFGPDFEAYYAELLKHLPQAGGSG